MSILQSPPASLEAGKPRKRPSAKASRSEPAEKVKATIHISARLAKILGVYAVMTDKTNSAVVEALIEEHLKRFVVSDRAKPSGPAMLEVSED